MNRHSRSTNHRWMPTRLGGAALTAAVILGTTALVNARRARQAERDTPPIGRFLDIEGVRLHYLERGDRTRGFEIFDETLGELRRAETPGHILVPAIYNLAYGRVAQGRQDEALELLAEAFSMRDALRSDAAADPRLAPLKTNPRFQALLIG